MSVIAFRPMANIVLIDFNGLAVIKLNFSIDGVCLEVTVDIDHLNDDCQEVHNQFGQVPIFIERALRQPQVAL